MALIFALLLIGAPMVLAILELRRTLGTHQL